MRSLNTRFLTLLFTLAFLGLCVSVSAFAGKEKNCDPPNPHPSCGGGGDDTSGAPDPSNLVRASFENFGGDGLGDGGISADGEHTCTYEDVTYDYWAWQERLLSPAISLVTGPEECDSPESRSDVSGGGRWFLMTSAGEARQDHVVRWLQVDFSDAEYFDGELSECLNLDSAIYSATGQYPHLGINADPCVDNLTVWLKADRILKNKANFQQLEISIRYRPDGSDYWIPWGSIVHVNPLYLRDPVEGSPFFGRDCRVMSTRSGPEAQGHERELAELSIDLGAGNSEVIGQYNLPMEVCVNRVAD